MIFISPGVFAEYIVDEKHWLRRKMEEIYERRDNLTKSDREWLEAFNNAKNEYGAIANGTDFEEPDYDPEWEDGFDEDGDD